MRWGVTLIELLMALVIVGTMSALALPRAVRWLDWIAVDRATWEVASFYEAARFAAIDRDERVRLELSADTLRAVFEGVADSVFLRRPGPARHAVRFRTSRAVIWIEPNGLGRGAANAKLVLWRGAVAESLTTSRLGRLKRWP
jgi:prepilin-type N-terminal cleavage/methylation domain-containing protein